MKTIQLGTTDLQVSRLCLGCMTYGEPTRGNHAWTQYSRWGLTRAE